MRLIAPAILLSLCTAVPAFSQNSLLASKAPAPAAATATTPSVSDSSDAASMDYEALRAEVARQNKMLADQVNAQKALVRKNESILRDAQKMDAANKRLDAERKRLETANAQLEKERQSLQSAQKPVESAAVASAPSGN